MFLKESIQKNRLKKIDLKRVPQYKSLQEITSVGFLFNFEEDNILDTIKRLTQILDIRSIKFMALGINYEKNSYPTNILDHRIKVINKKNLKYANVPDSSLITEFLEKEFDLYIDFGSKYFFPNDFISHSSKATFKIGRLNYKGNPFDLILDNFKQGTPRSYLNSLIHYLSSIRSF